ncbi:hypothetical protein OIV83_000419 [Microbotryomycetes sp. JL201]|nr:hypothetical protein OIV83_000419 [Microbotryomycetes sp. JL201]
MPARRTLVNIYGSPVGHSLSPVICNHVFDAMGLLDHHYGAVECPTLLTDTNAWTRDLLSDGLLGTCLTMPLKVQAMSLIPHEFLADHHAKVINSVNTTWQHEHSGQFKATNLDWKSVLNCLVTALTKEQSPFPPSLPLLFEQNRAVGFVIGAGGAARAAIYALQEMGAGSVLIVNRDQEEIDVLVKEWSGTILIKSIASSESLQKELAQLADIGQTVVAAVACIPSEYAPVTLEEKRVFELAKQVFAFKKDLNAVSLSSEFLPIPDRPILLDMAYKPPMTPMRALAESHGWETVCGAQAVLL